MELIVDWEHSQGAEQISNVTYFEVLEGEQGDGLYCEFGDDHTETFTNATIGGGSTE